MSTLSELRPVTPVGLLAQQLQSLVSQAEALSGTDASLLSGLQRARDLAGGLDPYLSRWSTPQSPDLAALAERTRQYDWSARGGDGDLVFLEAEMLSGHVEGQLLKMLVHATRARKVLEIGMFTGYSALAMAEALPADGRLVACDIDPAVAAFALENFATAEHGQKIEVRIGAAQDTLAALVSAGEVFDLVFVDADKAGYRTYLDLLLSGSLIAPHGLICVDNTLMQGEPWTSGRPSPNGAAIGEFNQAVAADHRVEQVIVPLRDGLTLIRRVS